MKIDDLNDKPKPKKNQETRIYFRCDTYLEYIAQIYLINCGLGFFSKLVSKTQDFSKGRL